MIKYPITRLEDAIECAYIQLEHAKGIFFEDRLWGKLLEIRKSLGLGGGLGPCCLDYIYNMYRAQIGGGGSHGVKTKHFNLRKMTAIDGSGRKVLSPAYVQKLAEMAGKAVFKAVTTYEYVRFYEEKDRDEFRARAQAMSPEKKILNNMCNTVCRCSRYRFEK